MSDEKRHRPDKKAAKRTQRRPKTFDIQCARNIEDRRLIELGMAEVQGRVRWNYFRRRQEEVVNEPDPEPVLGGAATTFQCCDMKDAWVHSARSKMKGAHKFRYSERVAQAIADIAGEVNEYQDFVVAHTQLSFGEGQICHAAPLFLGKSWYDWAMFRYRPDDVDNDNIDPAAFPPESGNDPAIMPAHLRAFVDLTFLPQDNTTIYKSAIYMVTEPVRRNRAATEQVQSDFFQPYLKGSFQVKGKREWITKMEIKCMDEMTGPACVIPDLDNSNDRAY